MDTRLLLASALAAAATLTGATLSSAQAPAPAQALPTLTEAQIKAGFTPEMIGHSVPAPTAFKAEKCYGIAKAGLSDCGATGVQSCAGLSKFDNDPLSWIYVPAGYCERIVGAKLTAG